MKCKLIRDMVGDDRQSKPAGTVIEHPKAWRLVQMGVAIADDVPCRTKCDELGLTPEKLTAAQKAYERADRGIHPDDFEPYDKGWMVGYLRKNQTPKKDLLGYTSNVWEPGPKFPEYQALLSQAEDDFLADEDDGDDADQTGEEVAP